MKQYEIFELEFKGLEPETDWGYIDLKATFETEGSKTVVENGLQKRRYSEKMLIENT